MTADFQVGRPVRDREDERRDALRIFLSASPASSAVRTASTSPARAASRPRASSAESVDQEPNVSLNRAGWRMAQRT